MGLADSVILPGDPDGVAFRAAMRGFAGQCSILTVGDGTEATGMVLTSAVSLSADPPLVLACVNRSASSLPMLHRVGRFGWCTLGAAHQSVAERFSGFGGENGAARYAGADWETAATGAQLLVGAPIACDCTVDDIIERGTHAIVIGRVRAIRAVSGAGALIYMDGRYRALTA